MPDEEVYQSPFSWRYGSAEMRALWSEGEKRRRWRRVWVALAEAQVEAGLVSPEQAADLRAHQEEIDIARAHQIEAEIQHDVMAEVRAFAEQCPVGGGIIHLGATSMDITDNAEATRQRDALDLLLPKLDRLLAAFADQIARRAGTPCIGWTHLQPAEPTTVGYRLALYAQDLLADEADLQRIRAGLRGKGIKGAVGSRASYADLLAGTDLTPAALEAAVMARIDLEAAPLTAQTYPRRADWALLSALAGLAGTIYRFAFDLRLLQSPPIGEWAEPFGARQVGSSAMPFKRNPVRAEKLDSLGRFVAGLPRIAWDNAAHCLLERTLDDSANRRVIIPQAFLAVDEMLITALRIVENLAVDEGRVAANLARYGVFAASERVLMALARAGADRQAMHERIREHSMAAWAAIRAGEPNPLPNLLAADPALNEYLPAERILALMDASDYTGDAAQRARALAESIRERSASGG
jgi:adenylosuccinate lyase